MMRGVMGLQISCSALINWGAFDHAPHAPQLRHYNYHVHVSGVYMYMYVRMKDGVCTCTCVLGISIHTCIFVGHRLATKVFIG